MFDKSDKALLTFRVLAMVFIIVVFLCGIVGGIILCTSEQSLVTGILVLVIMPFLCWFMWLSNRLVVSYMCDIKLIRNKLYELDNDKLSDIFAPTEYSDNEDSEEDDDENIEITRIKDNKMSDIDNYIEDNDIAIDKEKLYQLFRQNVITEKEYEQLIKELEVKK